MKSVSSIATSRFETRAISADRLADIDEVMRGDAADDDVERSVREREILGA